MLLPIASSEVPAACADSVRFEVGRGGRGAVGLTSTFGQEILREDRSVPLLFYAAILFIVSVE